MYTDHGTIDECELIAREVFASHLLLAAGAGAARIATRATTCDRTEDLEGLLSACSFCACYIASVIRATKKKDGVAAEQIKHDFCDRSVFKSQITQQEWKLRFLYGVGGVCHNLFRVTS